MATFGEIIAEKRKDLGLSQRELATRVFKEDGVSISPQYLNDLEKDRRNAPSDHLIEQFSKELGLPVDFLFLCAGSMPPEDRNAEVEPEQAVKAFRAFRREMRGGE